MRELLRFEFHKLFRAKVLYICAGVMILLIVLFIGIDKLTDMGLEAVGLQLSEDEFSEEMFSIMGIGFGANNGMTRMLSAMSNVYVMVLFGVFIAVYTCGDYGNGVIKNILTKGYSRTKVFFAKYIVTLSASLCYGLIAFLTGFVTGSAFWNIGNQWGIQVIGLLALQLLAIAAYNAFFQFLAAALKKMGPAMALSIVIPIMLPLVITIVQLLTQTDITLSRYWLAGCIDSVSKAGASAADTLTSGLVSAAYLLLCTLFGWLIARKREV